MTTMVARLRPRGWAAAVRKYATATTTTAAASVAAVQGSKRKMSPRERVGWTAVGVTLLSGAGFGFHFLGRPQPEDEYMTQDGPGKFTIDTAKRHPHLQYNADENPLGGYIRRARVRVDEFVRHFADPSSSKLLPDPLPEPYQRPYTLIIDLDDTLVHAEWSASRGWTVAKRPGADAFIAYLSNYYEIVVFTHQTPLYADPILNKLDPKQYIMYRLYRDGTKYQNGHHIKDLAALNRDLSKVIIMDDDEIAFSMQKDNGIKVPAWHGDSRDTYLTRMIPFLETLALSNVSDVRGVLKAYDGLDIPTAFAENQRRYNEMRKTTAIERQHQKPKGLRGLFRSAPEPEVDLNKQLALQHQQFLTQQQQQRSQETPTSAPVPDSPTTTPTPLPNTSSMPQAADSTGNSGWFGWLWGKQ